MAFRDDGSQFQNDAAAVNAVEQTSTAGPSVLPAVVPSERKSTAVVVPASPRRALDTVRSPYAPGPIRRSTDIERAKAEAFLEEHPEFNHPALGHDALMQLVDTARSDEDRDIAEQLADQGVPEDWSADSAEREGPTWSDER